MKFKYIGRDDCFCIELLAYKLVPKDKLLKNGQEIDVPDDLDRVITSLEVSGLFVKIDDNKGSKKAKKEKK